MFYFTDFTILFNYVVGWQNRSFLVGLLQYLAKNMTENFVENFLVKIRFR